jgi:hypothetical protein
MAASLDDETRAAFRAAFVEYAERYRDGDHVSVPRSYLLVLGRKR